MNLGDVDGLHTPPNLWWSIAPALKVSTPEQCAPNHVEESVCCVETSVRRQHGMSRLPEHGIWRGMRGRCKNKRNTSYSEYGGRGISVCKEWDISFEKFYLDMGPRPSAKHSLDRIDNDGNYTKENCRWATREIQSRNTRIHIRNNTGYRGVIYLYGAKTWTASIRYENRRVYLGTFKSREQAIAARKKAEDTFWGEPK